MCFEKFFDSVDEVDDIIKYLEENPQIGSKAFVYWYFYAPFFNFLIFLYVSGLATVKRLLQFLVHSANGFGILSQKTFSLNQFIQNMQVCLYLK